jgi:hypothetical protein
MIAFSAGVRTIFDIIITDFTIFIIAVAIINIEIIIAIVII